jgi:hypothetical protein
MNDTVMDNNIQIFNAGFLKSNMAATYGKFKYFHMENSNIFMSPMLTNDRLMSHIKQIL